MPSNHLVKEIFKTNNIKKLDHKLIAKISERKKQVFREIEDTGLIEGVTTSLKF
jgi:hypothetical protein